MRHVPRLSMVAVGVVALTVGCGEEVVAPDDIEAVGGPTLANSAVEGELLGNVYADSSRSTETDLFLT